MKGPWDNDPIVGSSAGGGGAAPWANDPAVSPVHPEGEDAADSADFDASRQTVKPGLLSNATPPVRPPPQPNPISNLISPLPAGLIQGPEQKLGSPGIPAPGGFPLDQKAIRGAVSARTELELQQDQQRRQIVDQTVQQMQAKGKMGKEDWGDLDALRTIEPHLYEVYNEQDLNLVVQHDWKDRQIQALQPVPIGGRSADAAGDNASFDIVQLQPGRVAVRRGLARKLGLPTPEGFPEPSEEELDARTPGRYELRRKAEQEQAAKEGAAEAATFKGESPAPATPPAKPQTIEQLAQKDQANRMSPQYQEVKKLLHADEDWQDQAAQYLQQRQAGMSEEQRATQLAPEDAQWGSALGQSPGVGDDQRMAVLEAFRKASAAAVKDDTPEVIRAKAQAQQTFVQNFATGFVRTWHGTGSGLVGTVAPGAARKMEQSAELTYGSAQPRSAGGMTGSAAGMLGLVLLGKGAGLEPKPIAGIFGAEAAGQTRVQAAEARAQGAKISLPQEMGAAVANGVINYAANYLTLNKLSPAAGARMNALMPIMVTAAKSLNPQLLATALKGITVAAGKQALLSFGDGFFLGVAQNIVAKAAALDPNRKPLDGAIEQGVQMALLGTGVTIAHGLGMRSEYGPTLDKIQQLHEAAKSGKYGATQVRMAFDAAVNGGEYRLGDVTLDAKDGKVIRDIYEAMVEPRGVRKTSPKNSEEYSQSSETPANREGVRENGPNYSDSTTPWDTIGQPGEEPPTGENTPVKELPAPGEVKQGEVVAPPRSSATIVKDGKTLRATVSTREEEGGGYTVNSVKLHDDATGSYERVDVPEDAFQGFDKSADAREAIFKYLEEKYPAKTTVTLPDGSTRQIRSDSAGKTYTLARREQPGHTITDVTPEGYGPGATPGESTDVPHIDTSAPTPIWKPREGYDLRAAQPLVADGINPATIDLHRMADGAVTTVQGKDHAWEITKGTDESGRPVITHFAHAGRSKGETTRPPAGAVPAPAAGSTGIARQARAMQQPEAQPDASGSAPQSVPPAEPIVKQRYTTIPKDWIGQDLHDFGGPLLAKKGQQFTGAKGRKTRGLAPSFRQQLERIPRDAKSLIAEVKLRTDEVWHVKGGRGGYVLAPTGAVREARAALRERGIDVEKEIADAGERRQQQKEKWAKNQAERERKLAGIGDELRRELGNIVAQPSEAKMLSKTYDSKNEVTLARAINWAKTQPRDSRAYLLAYLLGKAKKDPKGTTYQWVRPAELADGTELLIGKEKLTVEHDPDTGDVMLHDGVTLPAEDAGKIPVRQVRGAAEPKLPEGDLAPEQAKPAFYEGTEPRQEGVLGQTVFLKNTGSQQGLSFETEGKPLPKAPLPNESPSDAKIARQYEPGETGEMFGTDQGSLPPPPSPPAPRGDFNTPELQAARQRAADLARTHRRLSPAMRQRLAALDYRKSNPRRERTAIIVIGPAGAGKSTTLDPIVAHLGAYLADSDKHKKLAAGADWEDGLGAQAAHPDAADINARALEMARRNDANVVWPSLAGGGIENLRMRRQQLADAGYSVHLVLVDVPAEVAAQRLATRWQGKTQGFVDPQEALSVGNQPRVVYDALRAEGQFDSFDAYDNDVPAGQPPKLIDHAGVSVAAGAGPARIGTGRPGHGAGIERGTAPAPPGNAPRTVERGRQPDRSERTRTGQPHRPGSQRQASPPQVDRAGGPVTVPAQPLPGTSSSPFASQPAETKGGQRLLKSVNDDPQGLRIGPRSIVEFVNDLVGSPMLVGKTQTTTKHPAHYRRGYHIIRTRSGAWQLNFHEAGHALSALLRDASPLWMRGVKSKLEALTKLPDSFASAKSAEEGMAEFLRRYLTDPQSLDAGLVHSIETSIGNYRPQLLAGLRDAHRAWVAWRARPYEGQLRSYTTDRPPPPPLGDVVRDLWDSALFHMINAEAAIDRVDRQAFKAVRTFSTALARTFRKSLRDTPADYRSAFQSTARVPQEVVRAVYGADHGPEGLRVLATGRGFIDLASAELEQLQAAGFTLPDDLVSSHGDWIQLSNRSVRQIYQDIGPEEWPGFELYGQYRAALRRFEMKKHAYPGLTEGFTPDRVRTWLSEQEQSHPEWRKHFEELNHFMDQMLLVQVLSGEFDAATAVKIRQAWVDESGNEAYWPLPRQMEAGSPTRRGGAGAAPTAGVRRAFGSHTPFESVLDAVESRTKKALEAYYQNRLILALHRAGLEMQKLKDLPLDVRAAGSQLMLPLHLEIQKVATLQPQEQQKVIADYLNAAKARELGLSVEELPDDQRVEPNQVEVSGPGMPLYRAKPPRAVHVVAPFEKGKRSYYQVTDPLLFELFSRSDNPARAVAWFSRLGSGLLAPWKRLVTQNVVFSLRNVPRDMQTAMQMGAGWRAYIPGFYAGVGLMNRLKGDPFKIANESELLSKALDATTNKAHQTMVEKFLNVLGEGVLLPDWSEMSLASKAAALPGQMVTGLLKPIELLLWATGQRALSAMTEKLPREGAAVSALRAGQSRERSMEAADRITGNFAMHPGNANVAAMFRTAGFLNPGLQILYGQYQRASDPDPRVRGAYAAKLGMLTALGAVMAAINWLSTDEKGRKRLAERPDADRFHAMGIGGRLIVPFDNGVPGAAMSYGWNSVESRLLDDKIAPDVFAKQVLENSLSMPGPLDAIHPWARTWLELKANYSFYQDRPIVPHWMEDADRDTPELQYMPRTPRSYRWLGEKSSSSPLKIEYALRNTLSNSTDDVIRSLEMIARRRMDARELADLPFVGRLFLRDPTGWRSKSVGEIDDLDARYQTAKKLAEVLSEQDNLSPADRSRLKKLEADVDRLQDAHLTLRQIQQLSKQIKQLGDDPANRGEVDELQREMVILAREALGKDKPAPRATTRPALLLNN